MLLPYLADAGDFVQQSGLDCDINLGGLTALAYIDLVVALLCCAMILRYLIVRILRRKKNSSICPSTYAEFFVARTIFPYFFLLHSVGDLVFCVLKLYSKEIPLVGTDIALTIVAAFCPVAIFCGLVLYYIVIINFLKGYAYMMAPESKDKVDIRFHHLLTSSYSIPPLSIIAAFAPCVTLRYPEYQKGAGGMYLVGSGLIAAFYGTLYALALGFLITEIRLHIENSSLECKDLALVLWRLRAAYYSGAMLFSIALFSYGIFGAWDYLLRKSSYIFLIIQIACGPLVTALILSVSRISHFHRSIRSIPVPMRVSTERTAAVLPCVHACVHPCLPQDSSNDLWSLVRHFSFLVFCLFILTIAQFYFHNS